MCAITFRRLRCVKDIVRSIHPSRRFVTSSHPNVGVLAALWVNEHRRPGKGAIPSAHRMPCTDRQLIAGISSLLNDNLEIEGGPGALDHVSHIILQYVRDNMGQQVIIKQQSRPVSVVTVSRGNGYSQFVAIASALANGTMPHDKQVTVCRRAQFKIGRASCRERVSSPV